MSDTDSFLLFDSVVIEVDRDAQWAIDFLRGLGAKAGGERGGARLHVAHRTDLSHKKMRELDSGVWIDKASILDEATGVRLDRPRGDVLRISSSTSAVEWLMWGLQLASLLRGLTLVHAAAVEKEGRCALFPSWGGVGKTALVAHLVRNRGWRLLGDDLVALTPDGRVHAFPKSMVLYPYHRTVFPEIFAAGKGPVAPTALNEVLTRAARSMKPLLRRVPTLLELARKHNPQSTRVSPVDVFGSDAVSEQAQLRAAIWLERVVDMNDVCLERSSDTVASRIMGSTMNEFDARCVRLTNVAMGLGIVSADEIYEKWIDVLNAGLEGVVQSLLYIPAAVPVADVPALVERAVDLNAVTP